MNTLAETIKRVYSDAPEDRNLDWRSEPIPSDQLRAALAVIGQYNDFLPRRVTRVLLESFPPETTYIIARESSVAIYIRTSFEGLQGVNLRALADNVLADEVHITSRGLRIWWD